MTDTRDMTEGKILRQVIPLAVPLLLANMGQQLYMIVDGSIVGRGIGAKALASVGASDWCYWLILWSILSLTHGFSTFVSRFFGRHDYQKMNRAITNGAVLTVVIGGLLTVAGLLVSRPLLELLHTPGDIIDDAVIYIRTMLSGMLIVAAYNFTAAILRALLSCFIDASEKDAAAIMAVAWKYMFIMTVSIVLIYPMHIYRGALQSVWNSIWPMISGFAESLVRALMGTAAVALVSTEAIFYAEPAAWLFALLFVLVPYYLVRRKVLVSG